MKKKMVALICCLDVSKHLANHLIGEHHTSKHRRIFGVGIMSIGVILVKVSAMLHSLPIHILADIIGYGIHGIGLIPFASNIEKKVHISKINPSDN